MCIRNYETEDNTHRGGRGFGSRHPEENQLATIQREREIREGEIRV